MHHICLLAQLSIHSNRLFAFYPFHYLLEHTRAQKIVKNKNISGQPKNIVNLLLVPVWKFLKKFYN